MPWTNSLTKSGVNKIYVESNMTLANHMSTNLIFIIPDSKIHADFHGGNFFGMTENQHAENERQKTSLNR